MFKIKFSGHNKICWCQKNCGDTPLKCPSHGYRPIKHEGVRTMLRLAYHGCKSFTHEQNR